MNTLAPPQTPHVGEYHDRKRTLPKRIVKLSLSLASLKPGRYVYVVEVTDEQEVRFQQATLNGA